MRTHYYLMSSAEILSHYYPYVNLNVQEPHTWTELAQRLATATPTGIGAHPNMSLLTELLNPTSEVYIEGLRILLEWNCGRKPMISTRPFPLTRTARLITGHPLPPNPLTDTREVSCSPIIGRLEPCSVPSSPLITTSF